jgi:hypothetical protein
MMNIFHHNNIFLNEKREYSLQYGNYLFINTYNSGYSFIFLLFLFMCEKGRNKYRRRYYINMLKSRFF